MTERQKALHDANECAMYHRRAEKSDKWQEQADAELFRCGNVSRALIAAESELSTQRAVYQQVSQNAGRSVDILESAGMGGPGKANCLVDMAEETAATIATQREKIQRLTDLVRYSRHALHTDNLISNEEFSELMQVPGSVARLQSYDEVRAELSTCRAALEAMEIEAETQRALKESWENRHNSKAAEAKRYREAIENAPHRIGCSIHLHPTEYCHNCGHTPAGHLNGNCLNPPKDSQSHTWERLSPSKCNCWKKILTDRGRRCDQAEARPGRTVDGLRCGDWLMITERMEQAISEGKHLGKTALYFGCWDEAGHFLHNTRGNHQYDKIPDLPWEDWQMDAAFLKNGKILDSPDGRVFWTCGGAKAFWYAFYWWDRSVDKRGACNSGFYVRGFGWPEAQEAFDYACSQFPHVVTRQKFPLILQNVTRRSAETGG